MPVEGRKTAITNLNLICFTSFVAMTAFQRRAGALVELPNEHIFQNSLVIIQSLTSSSLSVTFSFRVVKLVQVSPECFLIEVVHGTLIAYPFAGDGN